MVFELDRSAQGGARSPRRTTSDGFDALRDAIVREAIRS